MKLVLDSNIFFCAILKNSTTRNILVSEEFELFLSEYALLEIGNHRQFLIEKTKLSESEFTMTLNVLLERTKIIADETLAPYLERAEQIMRGMILRMRRSSLSQCHFQTMASDRTTKTCVAKRQSEFGQRKSCLNG